MNTDIFLEIEKKYDLNNCEIDGIRYWNYIRWEMFRDEVIPDSIINTSSVYKRNINRFRELYYILKRGRIRKNIDVLFFAHERRVRNGKFYECVYTEELSKVYKNSSTFEMPYNERHFRPVNTHDLIYLDRYNTKANILYRFYNSFARSIIEKIIAEAKSQLRVALQEINHKYGCSIDENRWYEQIAFVIIKHRTLYKNYYRLIQKLSPKVIIEVVPYSFERMLINEIAKIQNIPTVELQHGIINDTHLAYKYPDNVGIPQFPDKIFVFSDYEKERLILPPISSEEVIVTGFPFFEAKVKALKKNNEHNMVDSRKTILFISQPTLGDSLIKLAIDLSKRTGNYRIIYKLHPSEYDDWRENSSELINSGIEIIDNNEKSIYSYFAESDVQIGVYSTAIYEGLGFGLLTLIYKVGPYDVMKTLVDNGYANFVESADDVIEYIDNKKEKTNKSVDEFWKADALQNMIREIDKIICK